MSDITKIDNEPLWVEAYRPQSLDTCLLKEDMRQTLSGYRDQKMIPNLILSGPPGCGKTGSAKALLNDIDADYLLVNGSKERNIDMLRVTVADYCTYKSLHGGRKYVLIDEAEYLNPQSTQPAMRTFMEQYSRNAGFILTCNDPSGIHPAIQSRCVSLAFAFTANDMPTFGRAICERFFAILTREGVEYDRRVVAKLVSTMFPDIRRALNSLQGYAQGHRNKIDIGILASGDMYDIDPLFDQLKAKSFSGMKQWVVNNIASLTLTGLHRSMWQVAEQRFTTDTLPMFLFHLGESQRVASIVIDPEIEAAHFLNQVMNDCKFL